MTSSCHSKPEVDIQHKVLFSHKLSFFFRYLNCKVLQVPSFQFPSIYESKAFLENTDFKFSQHTQIANFFKFPNEGLCFLLIFPFPQDDPNPRVASGARNLQHLSSLQRQKALISALLTTPTGSLLFSSVGLLPQCFLLFALKAYLILIIPY